MSSATFAVQDSPLDRLILAIGTRMMPRHLRGRLRLTLPSGRVVEVGNGQSGVSAEIHLKSYRPVWASMRRASVGFAASYIDGHWDSPDIAALLRFYLQNRSQLDQASKPVFFSSVADRVWHLLRDNDRARARKNIEAHYDLGNDFYRLWLDGTMTYSAACFSSRDQTLEDAQHAKYAAVCDALELGAGQEILEIGCGWGGFAEAAAARSAKITGITLSAEQLVYARNRLGGKAELRLEDYRDTAGAFDGIASIEMIEAVGEAHWPRYFQVLADRLKPGGAAVLQAITIDERWFPQYRRSADFIQRYIFPGGMLPTRSAMKDNAARAGLDFEMVASFGHDYARTLDLWRRNFESSWDHIAALGFDEKFRRKWRFYLDYCKAGFLENAIDVGIYRFRKLTAANS